MSTATAPNSHTTTQNFQEQYETYWDRLVNSMTIVTRNKDDAEDAASAAFAAAFEHRDSFRGESSFYTWLHAIALNAAKTRGPSYKIQSLDAMEGPVPEKLVEPDLIIQALDKADCCKRIRETLRRVPGLYRKVLIDRYIDGRSVSEIADRRRIPIGTVLSRIFKAKQFLRDAWGA